ncbi:MAG: tandem-95 repeat protein [Akkermansiaceae bacterium]|nr:tandem-95 repeat protein [Akkermansiaceae bacterium]
MRAIFKYLFFAIGLTTSAHAQINVVAANPASDGVALGETYIQNFNTLPTSGSLAWADNTTLKGWYANLTNGQVSTGNMVATAISTVSAVTTGSVGGSATLNSLGASGSSGRALGGTPSAYATGSSNIFTSKSVNVVLRLKNSTGGVLTGMKVAYDTVATSTGNKDAVAFAYRVFSAGSGTISSNFIETHRYLNPYNGTYDESMRTEFGRRISSISGWTCVVKDIAPTSGSTRTDSLAFTLKDLTVSPGDEVWLAWHIAKEDEQGASDPTTTTGIDNVSVSEFTVGRPGLPVITTHPRSLAVATGGTRDFALSVEAKGASLTYQWRKDSINLSGATGATYTATNVNSTAKGIYDCVVSTSGGSVTSLPAKVNIYARVPVTTVSDVSFASHSSGISQLKAATAGTLADLYYPTSLTPSSPDVPAVIVIHGGGGNNGDKLDSREVEAAQELAARGWFVIAINYAMSSSTVQCWPYNLWDAKQAVRWLKQKADAGTYAIDKNRIGVFGFSWGCNMGSMLAMTGPDDDAGVTSSSLKIEPPNRGDSYDSYSTAVQCSAVFYGAADLPNYHQMNQFLNKTAWSDRTTYRRASPIHYPNPNAAPMLMVHGSADDDVWQNQTESTYLMQRSVGAKLEGYLQVPGGEHSFGIYETSKIATGFPNPIDVRPETLGFMEKYLVETTERPSIIDEPVSKIVNNGETAVFRVGAVGTPAPTYQWRKDGVNISDATSSTFSVSASTGYYDVVVTNSVGSLTSAAALLTVSGSILVNVAPEANTDTATTPYNTAKTIAVLSNDTDANGDTLTIISVTQGTNGSVTMDAGGTVTYTPATNYAGIDSFTYTISDGNGGTDTGTANILIESSLTTVVAAEATVESGTNAGNDINETTQGYVSTKYSASGTMRKAYFQFDLGTANVNATGAATFTIRFNNSYTQRVQLWALNQTYPGFLATATWNGAQANDTTGNGMLASGPSTATAIGGSVMLLPGISPYTPAIFTIPNIGSYLLGGKVTLVLTGVDVTAADTSALLTNNSSGARYTRATASLVVPLNTNLNTPPIISAISNRSGISEDRSPSPISFSILDGQTAADSLILSVATNHPERIPTENIFFSGTGSNRTVQLTPLPNTSGTSRITITVTDSGGLTASEAFDVTINAVNDPPTITDITDQTISANNATNSLPFSPDDIDTAVASLVVTASSSDQTLIQDAEITIGGSETNRTITVTPVANRIGSATITVTVSDGVLSASDSFIIIVTASPMQTWWFGKFGTTDTTAAPNAIGIDSDNDGGNNLLEYSQGGDPLVADRATWMPVLSYSGYTFSFTYRKSAPDLAYFVQENTSLLDPNSWMTISVLEIDNGNGTYSITTPITGQARFFRLKVTAP